MKYLTKEWYQAMQNSGYHIMLIEINKAKYFSEEYFQKIYKSQEKHQVNMVKSWYEMCNYEKIYENYKGTTSKARLKWRNEFLKKDHSFESAIEEQKKSFKENHHRNIKDLEENLPKEILNQVADIRLLALNRCTPKIKKLITTFCENNIKYVEDCINKYNEQSDISFKNQNTEILKGLAFHDGEIISYKVEENDLVIRVSDIDSASKTGFGDIKFKNFQLIGEKVEIENAIWLYKEIYKIEVGYEFHVLLINENRLIEVGVIAKEIISTKQIYE